MNAPFGLKMFSWGLLLLRVANSLAASSLSLAQSDNLPAFLDPENSTVTVNVGDTAGLDCRVIRLRDKMVSWMAIRGEDVRILTIGMSTYTNDGRFGIVREYNNENNWQLLIRYAQPRDAGLYQCQISTHPPKIRRVRLFVRMPHIEVRDVRGEAVTETYYRVGSSIALQCLVEPPPVNHQVIWTLDGRHIDYSFTRGVSMKTLKFGTGLSKWLHIARATKSHSGNYTCSGGPSVNATVRVHVLDGESSAAMQHPNTDTAQDTPGIALSATSPFSPSSVHSWMIVLYIVLCFCC